METVIKSLNRYSILAFHDLVPDYVLILGRKKGNFTLGIVTKGEPESLIGMAVFRVSSTDKNVGYAEVIYVYIIEEYRRQGLGSRLLLGTDIILQKSRVHFSMALLPSRDEDGFGYELSASELRMFFIAGGYVFAEEEYKNRPSVLSKYYDEEVINNADRFVRHPDMT